MIKTQLRSKYEKNIFLQPSLIEETLDLPRPAWMNELSEKRIFFVGIGTSFHAAQIAKWLWRQHVGADAEAVHSFDFVRGPQPLHQEDVVVLFSHRGTKSFTVQAARKAYEEGAITIGITCKDSPWKVCLTHRGETCEPEDTGAFTKSLTCALAWVVRWIDNPRLIEGLRQACAHLRDGPAFPTVNTDTDLILIGDVVREWVAREIALKIQEAACLPVRAFGMEEFLHGPRVSAGPKSLVVSFSTSAEKRWEAVRKYLHAIEVPVLEVQAGDLEMPPEAEWLWQLFWGQRLTLDKAYPVERSYFHGILKKKRIGS